MSRTIPRRFRSAVLRGFLLASLIGTSGCAIPFPREVLVWGIPILGAGIGTIAWQLSSKPLDREDGKWVRLESTHFRLDADFDVGAAKPVLRDLELWWTALDRAVFSSDPGDPDAVRGPLHVIAVHSDWEREGVANHYVRGYYSEPDLVPPFLFIGEPFDSNGKETLKHEVVHALVHQRWPGAPHWLDEGMARYLQAAEVNAESGRMTWGRMNASDLQAYKWRGAPASVSELRRPETWTDGNEFLLSFRAGALVHMLMNSHPAELHCYLSELSKAADSNAVFQRCFPSFDQWDPELSAYETSSQFATRTAAVPSWTDDPRAVPLTGADVQVVLALLDIGMYPGVNREFRKARKVRIQAHLKRALALDSEEPSARALAAAWLDLTPEAREKRTAEVITHDPDRWGLWLLRARTPGLPRGEFVKACRYVWDMAPETLDEQRVSPCREEEQPEGLGWLPRESMIEVVEAQSDAVKSCFRPELINRPGLNGHLTVGFTIGSSGQIVLASVRESTLRNPATETCVLEVVRGFHFPPPAGGGTIDQWCRFRFNATNATWGEVPSLRMDVDIFDRRPATRGTR